ncbi:helicase-related protein [Kineococcus sp. SYSU DK002]|uniref:helicase-related protein n=1 Tax=Kineococcus sp. SYSU DK002 TaxID=3383123 RepID=UPI003D7D5DD7
MTTLETLVAGAHVHGVRNGVAVEVLATTWHGADALTLTYRAPDGSLGDQLLYRADEHRLALTSGPLRWTFDADAADFRLAAEVLRIRMAGLYDPMIAVTSSDIDPLPHQIRAVYGELLPRTPLRFLLADDPGAGKTIMAGLYARELMLRGDLARCLIVAPGSLVEQWQVELATRFGLDFAVLAPSPAEVVSGTAFDAHPLAIARMDVLARRPELLDGLRRTDWDLVVVDEAHRMSATYAGTEVKTTKRYELGRVLGTVARHLLLMTATPHAGKEDEFQLFLALLDADRFEGRYRQGVHSADTTGLMRRMVKEDLLTFEGKPLFPERRAETVPFALSPLEEDLYEEVTRYVRDEMTRADTLQAEGESQRSRTVGFALTVLQRRLASSPEAIHRSLQRRRARLQARREEMAAGAVTSPLEASLESSLANLALDDPDDLTAAEAEHVEEGVVDAATAARTVAELDAEIVVLEQLEVLSARVLAAGTDTKWVSLRGLFDDQQLLTRENGALRKLIVFTEHRDTLTYLAGRIGNLIGRDDAVVTIHGGVPREERLRVRERFTQDETCQVLVATDAAGEGLNLQVAHLMVNYDLPWNPNRLEQRFGRIHRIGQREVCRLWNLVAHETREGQVFVRLLEKAEEQRRAYGGRLFDVLGNAFQDRPLRELLVDAIRYGDQPERQAELDAVVDAQVADGLKELLAERALHETRAAEVDVAALRRQMDEARARRLQPHFVQRCATEAFTRLGGRLAPREAGRFEIPNVPSAILARATRPHAAVTHRYARVTFDPARLEARDAPRAELLAPGHPLLDAVLDAAQERWGGVLERGAALLDPRDPGTEPRLVVAVLEEVVNGFDAVVSKRFAYVTLTPSGTATASGAAPYLDAEPLPDEAADLVDDVLAQPWLAGGVEQAVTQWAVQESLPRHVTELRDRLVPGIHRTRAAVRQRLDQEVSTWWATASKLRAEEAAGRQGRTSARRAERRAEELEKRREKRLTQLAAEEQLTARPPRIVGAALVLPAGLVGTAAPLGQHPVDTRITERRAVDAVLAAERALGREPVEMPHSNPGYDVESTGPDGHLLLLEVKGRVAGADDFTVTANEVLFAKNAGDRYRLAMVEVSPDGPEHDRVRYLANPFRDTELGSFAATAVRGNWPVTWGRASVPF